ncbi:hypothetical protein [Dietzia sp. 179-F 9C3 NHS]
MGRRARAPPAVERERAQDVGLRTPLTVIWLVFSGRWLALTCVAVGLLA